MSAILLYCLTFLFFFLSMKIFFIFFLQQCLDVSLNWLLGFPGGSDDEESTCNAGDQGLLPGSGRSPGGRHSNPLQYSCLENLVDRGAWWATVHGPSKNRTRLKTEHTHTHRKPSFPPHLPPLYSLETLALKMYNSFSSLKDIFRSFEKTK